MKKGFTLVELLITVVILGLIISVSIPVVNVVVKNQEEKRYSYHEEVVVESSKAYKELFSNEFEENAMCYEIDYRNLISNDLVKEDAITCDEDETSTLGGKIQLEKSGNGYVYKPYLTCKNKNNDNIVSNGKNTHKNDCVEVSEYFVITEIILKELNSTGPKYNGQWINKDVYMEVKTNDPYMVGIKKYEYSVDNGSTWQAMSGNNHTFKSNLNKDVQVRVHDNIDTETVKNTQVRIDKTAPTCVSSGGSTTWVNTTRTINGTCSDTGGSGCVGNVTKTHSAEINSSTQSPGTVYDNAGNSVVCPSNQTVRIDKTAPTCVSSGGSGTWTNASRVITGTCSDSASGCKANVSKTLTTEMNSTTQTPGTVYDNAGNSRACPSNQTVRIDKTKPTIGSLSNSSGGSWTNQNVTLKATGADSASGLQRIEYAYSDNVIRTDITQPSAGALSFTTTGTWSAERDADVWFRAVDRAGNVSGWSSATKVRIDKTKPTIGSLSNSSGGSWTNQNVTLKATGADAASGLLRIEYAYSDNVLRTDITQPSAGATSFTTTGTWSAQRNAGVWFRAVDRAGNISDWSSETKVRIDKTAPTCVSSGGSATWTNGTRVLTGTCSDTGGSGCTGNVTGTWSAQRNQTNVSPGTVYDNAGNSTTCPANRTVKIDKTAPTCVSSGGSTAWTTGTRTLVGTCSDTGGSGCKGNISVLYSQPRDQSGLSPGTVYDNAGNSKYCPANQTVRIQAPSVAPTYSSASCTVGRDHLKNQTYFYVSIQGSGGTGGYASATYQYRSGTRNSGTQYTFAGALIFGSTGSTPVTITNVTLKSGNGTTRNVGSKTITCRVEDVN